MNIGHFEELILGAVSDCGRDAYGTPIHKRLQEQRKVPVSIGAVYTALMRLERRGFVTSRMGEATAERGGKAKRYYELTCQGATALRAAGARAQYLAGFASAEEGA